MLGGAELVLGLAGLGLAMLTPYIVRVRSAQCVMIIRSAPDVMHSRYLLSVVYQVLTVEGSRLCCEILIALCLV